MVFLGVDPGLKGAVASLSGDGKLITVSDFAVDKENRICANSLKDVIRAVIDYHEDPEIVCCLEKSHSMTAQGVTSSFNYGVTYGITYAVLQICGIKIHEITPQRWKKEFNLNSNKKAGIIRTKEDSVNMVLELYPSRGDTMRRKKKNGKEGFIIYDGRAEALLISEYCRRTFK